MAGNQWQDGRHSLLQTFHLIIYAKTPLFVFKIQRKEGETPIVPRSHLYGWSIVVVKMFIVVARTNFSAKKPQSLTNQLVQLSEVLDGADHLRGVAVLVRRRFQRRRSVSIPAISRLFRSFHSLVFLVNHSGLCRQILSNLC